MQEPYERAESTFSFADDSTVNGGDRAQSQQLDLEDDRQTKALPSRSLTELNQDEGESPNADDDDEPGEGAGEGDDSKEDSSEDVSRACARG